MGRVTPGSVWPHAGNRALGQQPCPLLVSRTGRCSLQPARGSRICLNHAPAFANQRRISWAARTFAHSTRCTLALGASPTADSMSARKFSLYLGTGLEAMFKAGTLLYEGLEVGGLGHCWLLRVQGARTNDKVRKQA